MMGFDASKLTMLNRGMLGSSSSLASSLALVLLLPSLACGLRSDPFALDTVGDGGSAPDDDDGDPNRAGTCNDPLLLPFAPMTLRGELSGPSFSQGWCGSDSGPEDVYVLIPEYDVDVLLSLVAAETEFPPTLRVVEDGCEAGTGFTKICTRNFEDEPFHFLAQGGRVYSVIIDSPDGSEGSYAFNVDFGLPPLDQCNVHPEVIQQISGSSFVWNNEFTQGQGRVDSYCGGPGRENMFLLQATYPGNMFVSAVGLGGFAPLVSVRRDCATLSELDCISAPADGYAELGFFISEPGQYFVVVDQAEIGAGSYQLRVDFE